MASAKWTSEEPTTIAEAATLSLCVVNYNGARYLPDTLAAAGAARRQFTDIFLLDNASTDRSVATAERCMPDICVVQLGRNRGPGAARNEGVRRAPTERILFVDSDVAIHPDCPRLLGECLDRNPDAVIAVPRVLFAADPATVQFEGAGAHFIGLVTLRAASIPNVPRAGLEPAGGVEPGMPGADCECGSLISACFLLDRERWSAGPLFDEELFLYLEDHEAGLRARLLGHRIVAVPGALCYHGLGTPGISIRETGHHSSIRIRETIKNRWQLVVKLYSIRTLALLSPALLLFELFQLIGAIGKGWTREWTSAVRALVRVFPSLVRRRRAFQSMRRVPDGAVLEGGPIPYNPATHSTRLERFARTTLDRAVAVNWRLVRRWLGGRRGSAQAAGGIRRA